jgi:acyl-CoA thioesterase FadM
MAQVGMPFSAVLKQGYTVVATEVLVHYKAPAFADDVLALQSWITGFRGARMFWRQELHRQNTGELLAWGEVTGAFTLSDGRPVRIPPAAQALLETLHIPAASQTKPSRRR